LKLFNYIFAFTLILEVFLLIPYLYLGSDRLQKMGEGNREIHENLIHYRKELTSVPVNSPYLVYFCDSLNKSVPVIDFEEGHKEEVVDLLLEGMQKDPDVRINNYEALSIDRAGFKAVDYLYLSRLFWQLDHPPTHVLIHVNARSFSPLLYLDETWSNPTLQKLLDPADFAHYAHLNVTRLTTIEYLLEKIGYVTIPIM